MTRREAVAALMALPATTKIHAVPSASDDVIVVEWERKLTQQQASDLREQLKAVWPTRKIVIFDAGTRISLVPR